ncbi:MAG: hypothetical protein KDE53_33675, partial [Caldilineaceae bacterium]|nr:hypothetical protein [Caldilineaceae bacterium]
GWVQNDFVLPGDIAVAQRLNIHGDLVQQQHHVLEHAYSTLPPARRQLLSHIACFRFGVEYAALQALAAETENPNLNTDLRDLLARGLVQRDRQSNRFDLHPIVRHYAYDRLAAAARQSAHRVLILYFEAVPAIERPQTLDDLQPLIELYHHMVRAGQFDAAWLVFRDRIWRTLYYQLGGYQTQIELLKALFRNSEENRPILSDEAAQAHALNELANSYSLSGQPRRAVPLFEQGCDLAEKQDNKRNLAIGLGNLAQSGQLSIGALRAAAANLRRRIDVCREMEDEYDEAVGHQKLGQLLVHGAAWEEAAEELAQSTNYWKKTNDIQRLCIDEAYRALLGLLRLRDVSPLPSPLSARGRTVTSSMSSQLPPLAAVLGQGRGGVLAAARRSLELADETARTQFPYERDYVRAHWLLGAAHRINHDLDAADHHLTEALTRCRSINMVDHEANILLDLARLRWAQALALRQAQGPDTEADALNAEALTLAQEALVITERSGYVLQGADVRLFLAEAALAAGDRVAAREHATIARDLAYCDGPPYSYKVAYDEAVALLNGLGP